MVMQDVSLTPEVSLTDIEDIEKWDSIIAGNDELLEKYIAGEPLKIQDLQREKCRRMQNGSLFPIYHGSAKNNIGTEKLIEVIAETFTSGADNDQSELCGSVFKIEYTDQKKRLVYLRLYSGDTSFTGYDSPAPKSKTKNHRNEDSVKRRDYTGGHSLLRRNCYFDQ